MITSNNTNYRKLTFLIDKTVLTKTECVRKMVPIGPAHSKSSLTKISCCCTLCRIHRVQVLDEERLHISECSAFLFYRICLSIKDYRTVKVLPKQTYVLR